MLLALVCATVFPACSDSDDGDGDTPPVLQEMNGPFDIVLDNITATSAYMGVTPKGYSGGYYFDVLTVESYAYNIEHGFEALIEYTVNSIMENDDDVTREDALRQMTSHNSDEWDFLGLDQGTEYYAVAMGIDANGRVCTGVKSKRFQTVKVDMSANTFNITVSNVTHDGADYRIVPSVKTESYVAGFINKSVADEFKSDDEIVEWCLSIVQDPSSITFKGDLDYTNQHLCQPGRDYYVVAFGYESGVVTTPVAKQLFSTTVDADPATCTFDIKVSNVTHNSATVSVTPSNRYNVFFWDIISVSDLEVFKSAFNVTSNEEAMAKGWEEELLPSMCGEMSATPAQIVDVLCTWGNAVGGTDTYNRNLKSDTRYVVWAVALDANGKAEGKFAISEPFTTSQEVISSVATVDLSIVEYFDGGEIINHYGDAVKDLNILKDYAVAIVDVVPSTGAESWYAGIFGEDLTNAARQSCLNSLIKYGGGVKNSRTVIGTAYWDDAFPNTVLAVGCDANGDLGEVARLVFTCSKDKAKPAEDFAKYLSSTQQLPAAVKPQCLK